MIRALLLKSVEGATQFGMPVVALEWTDSTVAIEPNQTIWDVTTARKIAVAILKAAEIAEDQAFAKLAAQAKGLE